MYKYLLKTKYSLGFTLTAIIVHVYMRRRAVRCVVKLLCMYELKNTDTPMTVGLILRCTCTRHHLAARSVAPFPGCLRPLLIRKPRRPGNEATI